ncbi:hypothetical protein GGS20DRAFT_573962 [Poronia punctata]|nr:hypothetical protein GGS20DRAFT_573962 [Poronia punctata]
MDGNEQDTPATAVGALVAALTVICVALRFYSRHVTGTGYKWDDWLALLALMGTLTCDVLVLVASSINPRGAHVASNTDPSYIYTAADISYNKLTFVAVVIYYTIVSATKLSILFMYRRLFWVDATFRRQVIFASVAVAGFWIGTTVSNLLNCVPLEWTWRNSLDDARYCFNYNVFFLASGAVEALIDVVVIAMPVRVVMKLRLDPGKKVAVAGIFLLGAFVILSGIVKVILSYEPGNREPSFSRTAVWSTVHIGTGIVCACLPVCWPLFVRFAKLTGRTWTCAMLSSNRDVVGEGRGRLSSTDRLKGSIRRKSLSKPLGEYRFIYSYP